MIFYALLGANCGPRLSTLKRAIRSLIELDPTLRIQAVSSAWEGQDGHLPHAPYINTAVAFTSAIGSQALVQLAKRIEQAYGRVHEDFRNAPIALDIDLLMAEDASGVQELTNKNLILAYCAVPLYEIATPRLGAWLMRQVRERDSNWEGLRSRLWMVAEPEDIYTLGDPAQATASTQCEPITALRAGG